MCEFIPIPTNFTVKEVPPLAYYIPNFITEDDENDLIKHINNVPLPKWTQLARRRLQNWGGIPHPNGMIAENIPDWLQKYINAISNLNIFPETNLPNHVLINEYLPGQGIMPHRDGPLFYPIITTISCGSDILLDFTTGFETENIETNSHKRFSFLLERRSLLVLQGDLYKNYLHSIAERDFDIVSTTTVRNLNQCGFSYAEGQLLERSKRISLTIRYVPKTSKIKLNFGK